MGRLVRGAVVDTMIAATSPTWIDFMATLLAVGAPAQQAVATTSWPSASAASAIERPNSTELPVTSHVSFIDT
jgi:hypothetical protein